MIGGIATTLMAVGTPPFVAPLVATVIVRSGVRPAGEETCRSWGEGFGPTDAAAAAPTPEGT